MTRCRGWRLPCRREVRYWVRIAYNGARHFPSEWRLCGPCAQQAEEFVLRLEMEHGQQAVDFTWGPLLTPD